MTPRLPFTLPPAAPDGLDSYQEIPLERIRFLLYQSSQDQTLLAMEDGSRLPIKEGYNAAWDRLRTAGWTPPPYRSSPQEPKPADPFPRQPVGPAEALALFLNMGAARLDYHPYLINPGRLPKHWAFGQTLTVTLNANDVLYWGAAAHADLPSPAALQQLYELWRVDPEWATLKYACWEANMQPQPPWQDMLKERNAWDEMLASLPANDDPSWAPEEQDDAGQEAADSLPSAQEPAPMPATNPE